MTAQDDLRLTARRTLRASGISHAAAARALGISPKHMSQMLVGHAQLTLGWAERIAALCDLDISVSFTPRARDQYAELYAGGLS